MAKLKSKKNHQSCVNPDQNLKNIGIRGLDNEFSNVFRQVFTSWASPPETVEYMSDIYTKGIQLQESQGVLRLSCLDIWSNILNPREPEEVNGPKI